MINTAAAENKAGHPADKDKMDKRRALGRGLESLLPRPRVITGGAAPSVHTAPNPQPIPDNQLEPLRAPAVPAEAVAPDVGPTHSDQRHAAAQAMHAAAPADSGTTFPSGSPTEATHPHGNLVVNLPISDIDRNPFQTRHVQHDDTLQELAESIRANGVVQPIVVRHAKEEGRYVLILGERRLHASKKAGKTTIPAIIRRVSDQQAAEMTIIENLQREDLSPLEQAEAFRVLSQEFNLTQSQIGERVGLARESVSNYMRLLKLPQEVKQLLNEKKINFAEAKELLKLASDEQITKAALLAVKKGLSLEQIERLVLSMSGLDTFPGMPGPATKSNGARWVDPNVRAAQMDLERLLGVRVNIRDRKGKGRIVIEYSTVDDYERVVAMLRGEK